MDARAYDMVYLAAQLLRKKKADSTLSASQPVPQAKRNCLPEWSKGGETQVLLVQLSKHSIVGWLRTFGSGTPPAHFKHEKMQTNSPTTAEQSLRKEKATQGGLEPPYFASKSG